MSRLSKPENAQPIRMNKAVADALRVREAWRNCGHAAIHQADDDGDAEAVDLELSFGDTGIGWWMTLMQWAAMSFFATASVYLKLARQASRKSNAVKWRN